MLPDGEIGFKKIIIEFYFFGNKRAGVWKLPALIYHEQGSVFIDVRRQRKNTALQRTHLSVTEGCVFALKKVYLAVPAFRKFVVLGALKAPGEPFFISRKQLFFAGKQIYPHGESFVFTAFIIIAGAAYAVA